MERDSSSSSSSARTLSYMPAPTTNPSRQEYDDFGPSLGLKHSEPFKPQMTWSPSPLRHGALAEDIYTPSNPSSQLLRDAPVEVHASVPIPATFARSISPSTDSDFASGSFTRSAAPIALFAEETYSFDTDAERSPSTARYGPSHSSVFYTRPSDALGLGFDDADLDLSFDDSPVGVRNLRRALPAQADGRQEPRSPSLRHVGRLPRRELGQGSGSEQGSIIGLSSPESSPPRPSRSRLGPAPDESPAAPSGSTLVLPSEAGAFYTPRVGGSRILQPDQPVAVVGSASDMTPSADERRTPRSTSATGAAEGRSSYSIPPLTVVKPKASLLDKHLASSESVSAFRSPSSRPSMLHSATRPSHSPRSPDSGPTVAATPTMEDYDAGESGFSSLTGRHSSTSGSSSMLGIGGRHSISTTTSSPGLSTGQPSRTLLAVYSDSEGEGYSGLIGLRQASSVSERWDEDFLFQEETGDDEPRRGSSKTKRKSRRRERASEKAPAVGEQARSKTEPSQTRATHVDQPASSLPGSSKVLLTGAASASAGSSRQPESRGTLLESGDGTGSSRDLEGPLWDEEDVGGDETMQESRRAESDDSDDIECWDGEMSMLSGGSANVSMTAGKLTASSSARTIMPAASSNLLMTAGSSRIPTTLTERVSVGLVSRRVTPTASKRESRTRLAPIGAPDSHSQDKDGRSLRPPLPREEDLNSGSSSQDHGGSGQLGLSSSAHSHPASASSRSSGTAAHLRTSVQLSSNGKPGSGYADSIHKRAAGSISAGTDFSARLAAQSDISSWHGHDKRPDSPSLRTGSSTGIDKVGAKVLGHGQVRQAAAATDAEIRARERARAWVQENHRESTASALPGQRPQSSSQRDKQPVLGQRSNAASAAEDTETEGHISSARQRWERPQEPRASGVLQDTHPASKLPLTDKRSSTTATSLASLLSFQNKKGKETSASPNASSPTSKRAKTVSRVQKLATDDVDSRPPSRAGSTSSRSPESQRDRIKKILVQQRKQRKEKGDRPSGSSSPQIPTAGDRNEGHGRDRRHLHHPQGRKDTQSAATTKLRPASQSPARSVSPFGRGWDAIRTATASGFHKMYADNHTQQTADDPGLPASSSAELQKQARITSAASAHPRRNLPSTINSHSDAGVALSDHRSASSSTAVTNTSSAASSDFWARRDQRPRERYEGSKAERRLASGASSNTTTPTLGSHGSPKIPFSSELEGSSSPPPSPGTSASKTSTASARQTGRPSTSPTLPRSELVEVPKQFPASSEVQSGWQSQASTGTSAQDRSETKSAAKVRHALKISPGRDATTIDSGSVAGGDTSGLKLAVRRNSLSDLKIPSRISRAQDGIRANMTYLRDFARGISDLKSLQTRYHAALLELHGHQERHHSIESRIGDLDRKLDDLEQLYAPWWECADVLIGLGDGRGDADQSASLDTLTHSPAPNANRHRRITLNTPPKSMHGGNVPMSKDLSSDATSSMVSDSSSSTSMRRADTSTAASRASSMSGRQVAAQREMDILSLMLAGIPLDSGLANQSRDEGKSASHRRLNKDEVIPGAGSIHFSTSSQSSSSQALMQASPTRVKVQRTLPNDAQKGPYKDIGSATTSTASFAAMSTDSFVHMASLDPDKSGRRKLRNASRAGLQGLRELLRSFKLSSNHESGMSAPTEKDSEASTSAVETQMQIGTSASSSMQPSRSNGLSSEGSSRPTSALGGEPSPTRRRSKIFGLVSAGLSNSRLDALPLRQRVISTASSSAQSTSHAEGSGPDNSADSGWARSEFDHSDSVRASTDSARLRTQSNHSPAPATSHASASGARHRLFSLGRQLIGSRPRADSITSKQSISPANLSIPLPAVEGESVSPGGESGFSLSSSSALSDREPAMGPPNAMDQLTLGRRHGDRIQMGLSSSDTIRRPTALGSSSSGDPRRPSIIDRASESSRVNVVPRPPAFGRSFSASPSPVPSPSTSLQQMPAVSPLPGPVFTEGLIARTRETASTSTTSSFGTESWASLGFDGDANGARTTSAATAAPGSRLIERAVTSSALEGLSATAVTPAPAQGDVGSTPMRPTTSSDAAAMSRFRKLILRPDAIRSLLAYVQATRHHCEKALAEVSRLAETMETGSSKVGMGMLDEGGSKPTAGIVGGGSSGGGMRARAGTSVQRRLDETVEEEDKEVLGTIRSPSATTPKRASIKPSAAYAPAAGATTATARR